MTRIHNLPLDVLFCIVERLSLVDLASVSEAFEWTASATFAITGRHAVDVISALLVTATPKIEVVVADNGACYKFQLKNPRAGRLWHRQDHAHTRPCGGVYNPNFSHTMQHSRTFHQISADRSKAEMILHANCGKSLERCARKMYQPGADPAEMVALIARFSSDSLESDDCGVLHLEFDTLSEDIDHAFTDTINSSFQSTRVITHSLPLRGAYWTDSKQKISLPSHWFRFLGSGISAQCTFSRSSSQSSEPASQWKMLFFDSHWSLPFAPSNDLP
jgi:hypothetical protein